MNFEVTEKNWRLGKSLWGLPDELITVIILKSDCVAQAFLSYTCGRFYGLVKKQKASLKGELKEAADNLRWDLISEKLSYKKRFSNRKEIESYLEFHLHDIILTESKEVDGPIQKHFFFVDPTTVLRYRKKTILFKLTFRDRERETRVLYVLPVIGGAYVSCSTFKCKNWRDLLSTFLWKFVLPWSIPIFEEDRLHIEGLCSVRISLLI